MTRKEGFIEVDKILKEIGVDTTDLDSTIENPQINIIKNDWAGLHFSFIYRGETYFYKCSLLDNGTMISPYNELVAEELAKDFGIPCVDYDLAVLGSNKGVLSKDFKKSNANYILGTDIKKGWIDYYDSNLDYDLVKKERRARNNLDDIWDKLEKRYQNYPNKREVIANLMKQLVNIYLFDIITCQNDRHEENWQIVEDEESIDIILLYDNERILASDKEEAPVYLFVDYNGGYCDSIWDSIKRFQKVSSDEFTDIIKEKLWVISEENLHRVFERIEAKTGYPMPEERKDFYLNNYQEHKKRLEEILGNEDIRKR